MATQHQSPDKAVAVVSSTAETAAATASAAATAAGVPQEKPKSSTFIEKWNQFTNRRVKKPMLRALIRTARFSAENPVLTIVSCVGASLMILILGFVTNFKVETEGDILWTPLGCTSSLHGAWIASLQSGFPQPSRDAQVLIHASGDNVLGLAGLSKLFQAVDLIRSTPGYQNVCAQARGNNDQECPIYSPTGLWKGHNSTLFREITLTDQDAIQTLSQLEYAGLGEPVDRSFIFGQPLPALPSSSLLLTEMAQNGTILLESATAYLATIRLPPILDYAMPFEAAITERLLDLRDEWAKEEVAEGQRRFVLEVNTFRAFDDELNRSIADDIPLMGTAFVLMGAFCAITLGRWNPVLSQSLVGVAAVVTIFLALMTGYGLMFLIGIPFTSLTQIFPYVMVGIGLDDTFIITGALSRTDPKHDLQDRMEQVMNEIGISISVSTLTTFVAFLTNGATSVPGMKWFAWYAAPTVAIDFIYQVTFFIAVVAIDDRRQKANRRDCCPCCLATPEPSAEQEEINDDDDDKQEEAVVSEANGGGCAGGATKDIKISTKIIDGYANLILKPCSKVIVLVVFAAMLVWGGFGAAQQTQEFDWRILVPDPSFLRDFFVALEGYVGQQGNVFFNAAFYFRDMDVSDQANQDAMFAFVDDMVGLEYIVAGPRAFWLRDFLQYSNQTEDIQNLEFFDQLDVFLSTEPYRELYRNDIVRDDQTKHVLASRTRVVFDGVSAYDNEQQIDALNAVQGVAQRQPVNLGRGPKEWKIFGYGDVYNVWELYTVIFSSTIGTVVLGLASVFVIALVFLPHPFGALFVTPVVAAIYLELMALLYMADIYINSISAVGLTMSMGLVVDYNMHVVLTYFETKDATTREDRVRTVLHTMGQSIMLGGFSTFLGVLPLSFSSSEIFRTFFVTFIGIIVFGVGHGLIFTPVVLSLIGPLITPEKTPLLQQEDKSYDVHDDGAMEQNMVEDQNSDYDDMSVSTASA
jgi:Niemann-Pick C1 protein